MRTAEVPQSYSWRRMVQILFYNWPCAKNLFRVNACHVSTTPRLLHWQDLFGSYFMARFRIIARLFIDGFSTADEVEYPCPFRPSLSETVLKWFLATFLEKATSKFYCDGLLKVWFLSTWLLFKLQILSNFVYMAVKITNQSSMNFTAAFEAHSLLYNTLHCCLKIFESYLDSNVVEHSQTRTKDHCHK